MVLTVDEDREQTRKIHQLQRQRKTLAGLLANQDRDLVRRVHQNAQRLLRPLLVANPFAEKLTFLDDRTRTRRDHMKYLTLIQSICLLHQYQRPIKTIDHHGRVVQYIEVTLDDIAVANQLAHQVLGRSLDELPPQTRRLLNLLDEMVTTGCNKLGLGRADYHFTRRQVREFSNWGNTQLKVHMARLEEQEYLLGYRTGRGLGMVYELLWDGQGQDGTPFLTGLLDVESLGLHGYDARWSGQNRGWSGETAEESAPGRPEVGAESAPGRGGKNPKTLHVVAELARRDGVDGENALLGTKKTGRSYVLTGRSLNSSSLAAAKSC